MGKEEAVQNLTENVAEKLTVLPAKASEQLREEVAQDGSEARNNDVKTENEQASSGVTNELGNQSEAGQDNLSSNQQKVESSEVVEQIAELVVSTTKKSQ